jgi:hypothetical protein
MENVWQYLRGNKLAITVFQDYDDIVDKSCAAWNFFANDRERIESVTTRSWATKGPSTQIQRPPYHSALIPGTSARFFKLLTSI